MDVVDASGDDVEAESFDEGNGTESNHASR